MDLNSQPSDIHYLIIVFICFRRVYSYHYRHSISYRSRHPGGGTRLPQMVYVGFHYNTDLFIYNG